ncbi:cytochrome c550 [Alkalibacillus aidingensis]|uniref:cytochrome c550 n=1 Tax=Alkalibacillus aidingensis TaxID=2747607 RepID=UPI001661050F|nr:cytochrome c [Alkalibacillus aidingensis]
MRRNPVVPYVVIGILGILAIIIMSGVGLEQMNKAEEADDGEETTEEASADPETIYENNCMSCHGGDLEGGTGPELANASDRFSIEELEEIIANGVEGSAVMTGDYASDEEAEILAEWLMEQ